MRLESLIIRFLINIDIAFIISFIYGLKKGLSWKKNKQKTSKTAVTVIDKPATIATDTVIPYRATLSEDDDGESRKRKSCKIVDGYILGETFRIEPHNEPHTKKPIVRGKVVNGVNALIKKTKNLHVDWKGGVNDKYVYDRLRKLTVKAKKKKKKKRELFLLVLLMTLLY
ncbi:hypothetical protein BDA99DRAFT_587696 [Phascolomyces articulosus]|uniref:Uncharacterized protein n=1 Tax=Phascolomyces articulosus TaxID=60185 RepID=A0AAD5K3U1_9FUNG|nr:hypothetical protein BDA99DRAFT_587696 [Phascolomyces articulosus]